MSWQLGTFGLLAVALAAGFGWYERTRPDARVVALVGTLAAFAALGRIAFAALPNVKPTTDIVLITGYALGGAPGFVVGAVAALTSNFFFGQGPWTVWQMTGWAAVGVLGAGIGFLARGRVGRWPLAAACGVVGFGFTAFQDLGDWVNYSDHSAAQLGVYVGKGLGFDAVHAAGCVVFALVFGPALIRSVTRFASRLQVSWPSSEVVVPSVLACVAGMALLVALPPAARAGGSQTSYLLGAQNGDGGYGAAPGQPSSSMYAAWTALGLESVGVAPQTVARGGGNLLAYVERTTSASDDPGALERAILVERAASAGGGDLLGALRGRFGRDGSISHQVNLTAFGVLALRAAGVGTPPATLGWLLRQQNRDGGFSFASAGAVSDIDDTGAALEALGAAGGAPSSAFRRAVGYLRAQQNSDGGLPQQSGGLSNAQSTAWGIQGLYAAGADPGSMRRHGRSLLDYLRSLIAADGHVRYSRQSDQTPVWVTGEALMALAGKALPLPPAAPQRAGRRRRAAVVKHHRGPAVTPARVASARAVRARVKSKPKARAAVPAALQRAAGYAGFATAILLAPVGVS
jgi:energy-coupling factor transport system substrate-specific component